MNGEVVAVFIPIILFLVIGVVLVSYYYLRSRERQILIEKGLDAESIKDFFVSKRSERSSYNLLKIGIISVAFGIGLGLGIGFGDRGPQTDFWIPLSLFVFTGAGFIVANIVGKKLDDKDKKDNG
ncbi:MAG TPA: hypothetical protein ENI76_07635 [Ignavibacteria bacterium]|nr:hypothetical protein [Ignavibacteria bacterium]